MKISTKNLVRSIQFSLLALLAFCQLANAQSQQNNSALEDIANDKAAKQAPAMGPLSPLLKQGNQGAWTGQYLGSVYRLINPKKSNDIKYFFVNTEPKANGRRTIEVNVAAPKGDGLAGLLYGFQENPKEYYMLVLNRSGTLRLFHRTAAGIKQKFSMTTGSKNSTAKEGQVNLTKLTMVEDGDSVKILVNDKSLGSFKGAGTGNGGVGIVAVGIVDALFHEFDVRSGK